MHRGRLNSRGVPLALSPSFNVPVLGAALSPGLGIGVMYHN